MEPPDHAHPDNPWRRVSSAVRFENPWIRIDDQQMIDPSGAPRSYGIVRFKKLAVGVLPIERDGTVHLVGQWRVPLERYSWEMPEGGCEPDESPEACALRELEEEAGLKAATLIEALRMDLSNSVTDERAICFIALDLSPGAAAPEPTEVFKHRRIPFLDLLEEVASGRITDSLTVAAALRAHHMAVKGEIEAAIAKNMLAL